MDGIQGSIMPPGLADRGDFFERHEDVDRDVRWGLINELAEKNFLNIEALFSTERPDITQAEQNCLFNNFEVLLSAIGRERRFISVV